MKKNPVVLLMWTNIRQVVMTFNCDDFYHLSDLERTILWERILPPLIRFENLDVLFVYISALSFVG